MTDIEPTLAATRAAAAAVRQANHSAYRAPGHPVSLDDRVGAAHELLLALAQLIDDLTVGVQRLADMPGLASTRSGDPAVRGRTAAAWLAEASGRVESARDMLSDAWGELETLYVETDEGSDGE